MEPTESNTPSSDQLQCDICLKSFPDAALLSLHQWIHAGSSSDPPLATVKELFEPDAGSSSDPSPIDKVLCEPDVYIKPEEIKEELLDMEEQEDGGKEKCEMAQNLNKDLIKCEDIKMEVEDTERDALNDQLLLDDSVSIASRKDIENQKFVDTCMNALKQNHSRKVQQVKAPRPERIKHVLQGDQLLQWLHGKPQQQQHQCD